MGGGGRVLYHGGRVQARKGGGRLNDVEAWHSLVPSQARVTNMLSHADFTPTRKLNGATYSIIWLNIEK